VRHARLLFVLLTFGWVVLVLAAPIAALGAPTSALAYAFGSLICHQRPERSFHIGAAQLPVCARCFGIYAGAAIGLVVRGPTPTIPGLRIAIVAAAIPTLITWGTEAIGLWSPANMTRFVAALPLGAVVAVTVNYVGCARQRLTGPNQRRIPI
jgi:uncharacterized membrane protein